MKIAIFLLLAIFVYVDADVYTITVQELKPQNEQVLSVESNDDDNSEDGKDCLYNLIVRKSIPDTALYDGYGSYAGTKISKTVQLCNIDVTDISGTMSYVLWSTLGLDVDDEIACPIEEKTSCVKSESKIVAGNFEGVFNDTNEVTLNINLPTLIKATLSISKTEGLPVVESETDSSVQEEDEMENEIKAAAEEDGKDENSEESTEGESTEGESEDGESEDGESAAEEPPAEESAGDEE